VTNIDFIPIGDSAYSYRITDMNEVTYYLKLFDHSNDRQMDSLWKLNRVLPLLRRLYRQGTMQTIAIPINNEKGVFHTTMEATSIILFQYIDGETLANAYPFSNKLLHKLGKAIANIHQTDVGQSQLLKENFDLSFEENFKKCINMLENYLPYKELGIVLKKKEQVFTILRKLHDLRNTNNTCNFVFGHGNLWGGNLIQGDDNIFIIDWESAILAPPEYDLFTYIGDGFETLLSAYQESMNKPVHLNLDFIQFYAYRYHLRNLANWLMNILFRNKNEEQTLNDIEMIQFHCLNRLDSVEANMKKIELFCRS